MPRFIGPRFNRLDYKPIREDFRGNVMYVESDPMLTNSGCEIVFDARGRFELPSKGLYHGEKWKDILEWILKLPMFGTQIFADPTDPWWKENGARFGLTWQEITHRECQLTHTTDADGAGQEAQTLVRAMDDEKVEVTGPPPEALRGH